MKVIQEKEAGIDQIAEVLDKEGLVIMPTETVYGAMVDATNPEAIKKLSTYKKRPLGKPYSIAVADQKMAEEYVLLNQTAKNLYKRFLPGPVTVISKLRVQSSEPNSKLKIAPGITSELGTLGIRIPDYPLVLEVVKKLGRPVTATSANASYKKRPYKIADILNNISDKQKQLIDLVIDAGELPHNEPSTVIDTTLDDPTILRQGEIIYRTQNTVNSQSEENTRNLGKELWQKYEKYAGQRAIIFALEGPMGAGKTQFTKGLAKAMGITDIVVSPTYILNSEFKIQNSELKLEHIDAWRLQNGEELEELGLRGLINDRSVMAIEWADRVEATIRKYNEEAVIIWVKIGYGNKENERTISWGNV